MDQPLKTLRRADQPAGAAHIDLALFRHRLGTAFRAGFREVEGGALFLARQIIHHLGNHVASALDAHPVAGPHAQSFDLIAIVQGNVGHDDPADGHRRQPPHGRQLAGAAHLYVDRLQRGLRLFRREFMRNRPARRLGDEAKPRLPVQPVDLVDHAVDIIRHVGTLRLYGAVMRQ